MTDIIKDFEEKISGNVKKFLKTNKNFEMKNIDYFLEELSDIGANNPKLISFGNDSYDILSRNLGNEFGIFKIPHYATYTNKEKYREQVFSICSNHSD